MKARVIVLTHGLHPPYNEGTINTVRTLIKGINNISCDIDLSVLSTVRGLYAESFDKSSVHIDSIRVNYVSTGLFKSIRRSEEEFFILNLYDNLRMANDCIRDIQKSNTQCIIHTFNLSSIIALILKLVKRQIPIVYSLLISSPVSLFIKMADVCICSSSHIYNKVKKSVRSCLIFPPVDTNVYRPKAKSVARQELGIDKDALVLTYLGPVIPGKLPPHFLDVVKKLNKVLDVKFYVWSLATPKNLKFAIKLGERAHKLGICSNLRLILKNLTDYEKVNVFCSSDIAVFPYATQRLNIIEPPLSIMEAMATGTPVISSNVASVKDIIDNSVGKILRPCTFANLNEWYKEIRALLEDSSTLKRLSRNAVIRSRVFSMETIAKKVIDVYKELISGSKRN